MHIAIPIKVKINAKASTDTDDRKLELIEQRLSCEISDDERQYLTELKGRLNGNTR